MNKKIIEEYNDKLSLVYDKATKGEFKWLAPHMIAKRLMPLVKKDNIILDLGCGTGQSAEPFIKKGCRVIGLDTSAEMLKVAKKYGFLKLCKHDIEKGFRKLSFQKKSFDAIIAVGIIEFIKNFKKLIKELSDLTKSEGYIAFTYEPIVEKSKLQYKKVSLVGEDIVDPIPKLLSFKIYRYTKKEVKEILSKNKINIIYQGKFIGYYKTKDKIPIYYEMVVGRKQK